MMPYDEFKERVVQAIEKAGQPLTWTEIRTVAGLPQLFPNNQWSIGWSETSVSIEAEVPTG